MLLCVSEVRKTFQSIFSFHYKVLGLFSELPFNSVQTPEHSIMATCLTVQDARIDELRREIIDTKKTTSVDCSETLSLSRRKCSESGCGLKGGKVSFTLLPASASPPGGGSAISLSCPEPKY